METDCKNAGKDQMKNERIMHITGEQRRNEDILNQAVMERNHKLQSYFEGRVHQTFDRLVDLMGAGGCEGKVRIPDDTKAGLNLCISTFAYMALGCCSYLSLPISTAYFWKTILQGSLTFLCIL